MLSYISIAQLNTPAINPNKFKGVLYDLKTGHRLEGASISIECDQTKVNTLTDENGYFILHGAPTNCFTVTITMPGFERKVLEHVNNILEVEYYIGLEQTKVKQSIN
ncbi:MAG: carboxypeptidase-like regulatory domain-containing protein [Saprospiraceae bacterium]|nr:carboxypeptidase-like regulatory domain-containing protein [Saprospiraceae bacterium]